MAHGKSRQTNHRDTISFSNNSIIRMKNILIFGVGLIGGSIALKSKKTKLFEQIIAVERKGGTILSPFVESGMLDRLVSNLEDDVALADLIVIATPVSQISEILEKIYPYLNSKTLITDVGSTKKNVMDDASKALKEKSIQFIGSHPIAGSEKHGPDAAQLNLFEGKNIVLTPTPDTPTLMSEKLNRFWLAMGGSVSIMAPQEHDEIFSTISHLPHLLAFSLVNLINNKEKKEVLLNFAASGFRDFSRIAASSPEVWRDISISNKDAILIDLNLYQQELQKVIALLEVQDQDGLKKYLTEASSTRQNWTDTKIE